MALDELRARYEKARKPGFGLGLVKGMAVTLKHLFKHNTVIQYPDEKQDLSPRTRGVIALKEENCTVCMLCARECPDWCIYIDSHKETLPPKREGGRPRKRNVLDRFAIDYALCMYCGICVEVCPYDALFWSREFEYAEYDIRDLTHEKEKLSDWMATVLPPPPLESGAMQPGEKEKPPPGAPAKEQQPATAPTPATPTASAAGARPEQAAAAPKAPTAAPAPPRTEAPAEGRAPAKTAEVQREKVPPAKAETEAPAGKVAPAAPDRGAAEVKEGKPEAEAKPEEVKPTAKAPPAAPAPEKKPAAPPAGASPEEAEAVYARVLEEQLAKGSSRQVAEARAKVARVKAERGVGRPPTPVETEKRVPSAPVEGEPPSPTPSGAPQAEEPAPEQGPVAPTEAEAAEAKAEAGAEGEETPDQVYERVLAAERAKGSSEAVALGRAKAARVRAEKGQRSARRSREGNQGPEG